MGGKELKGNVSEFCNRLNINFCLVLDRSKTISPDFSSYNKFDGGLVSDFLVDPNGFEVFSSELAKREKKNIYLKRRGPRRFPFK